MAYDARIVANEFIATRLKNAKRPLTNMQLQKLVYIAHGYTLAILHDPLVEDVIEAWRWGPVIPILYDALRQYGAGYVTDPIAILSRQSLTETNRAIVATVESSYGRFTGPQLSTMTHKRGTPWDQVYDPKSFSWHQQIPDDLIEAYYVNLLNEREGIRPEA